MVGELRTAGRFRVHELVQMIEDALFQVLLYREPAVVDLLVDALEELNRALSGVRIALETTVALARRKKVDDLVVETVLAVCWNPYSTVKLLGVTTAYRLTRLRPDLGMAVTAFVTARPVTAAAAINGR